MMDENKAAAIKGVLDAMAFLNYRLFEAGMAPPLLIGLDADAYYDLCAFLTDNPTPTIAAEIDHLKFGSTFIKEL